LGSGRRKSHCILSRASKTFGRLTFNFNQHAQNYFFSEKKARRLKFPLFLPIILSEAFHGRESVMSLSVGSISSSSLETYRVGNGPASPGEGSRQANPVRGAAAKPAGSGAEALTPEEQTEVQKLQQRDQEVRSHESAHVAAGGQFVRGGASFEYQKGPDGKQYAVGGEVSIDASPIKGNPDATLAKMQTVQRAALAPASPSGQDRSVAASAAQQAAAALQQKMKSAGTGKQAGAGDQSEEANNAGPTPPSKDPPHTNGYTAQGKSVAADSINEIAALLNIIA
jgi:hypothetical protein